MLKTLLLVMPLSLLMAASAQAAADKYQFDKDHTHILFHVSHLDFSQMWGRVKEFDGSFTFDEKEPEKSTVEVTMKVASIDTDVPALNKTLAGDKFFNAAKFPTIHFKSTGVSVTPAAQRDAGARPGATVTGELTMLGVTKPVNLYVVYNKSGVHPYTNNFTSGFTATALIKRSDFGMKSYLPDVGDMVAIRIEAEGTDALKHPGNSKTPH